MAVFCEGLPVLADSDPDSGLAVLIRLLQDTNNLFVGEGASDAWSSAYEVAPILKAANRILALQMDDDTPSSVVDRTLPRLQRADRVPGRGFWVTDLGAIKVQVPVHG